MIQILDDRPPKGRVEWQRKGLRQKLSKYCAKTIVFWPGLTPHFQTYRILRYRVLLIFFVAVTENYPYAIYN